jgi:hypothetical protein
MTARRGSRAWPALLIAALALALPAAGSASDNYVTHAGFSTTGVVPGTNGFKLQFWEGSRRNFKLTVKGHHSKTVYEAEGGPIGGGRVSGRLGRRGGFDLRFVPAGRPRFFKPPSWCLGRPYRWQPGYLVGHFAFRGERDYTRARGHRVYAARESWSSLRCHYARGPERHPAKEARLHLGAWSNGRHGVDFAAALFHRQARPGAERVEYRATVFDRSGPVSVGREVAVAAPEGSIAFPGTPRVSEAATVSPPAPFVGTAAFTRTRESTFTWTGDLAVDFPGLGPVRLAGPRFGARLCTLEGCVSEMQEHPSETAGPR